MSDWRLIETAPHNGTEVLLSNPTDGYVVIGHYVAPADMVSDHDDDEPDWFTTCGDYLGSPGKSDMAPTHWMPLPDHVDRATQGGIR